jgi:hypothetical protein
VAVLPWTPHFKLFPKDGSPGDEYRIHAGRVEVRALGPDGEPYKGYSEWIALTPQEVKLHFVRSTPVASWLRQVLSDPKPKRTETCQPKASSMA